MRVIIRSNIYIYIFSIFSLRAFQQYLDSHRDGVPLVLFDGLLIKFINSSIAFITIMPRYPIYVHQLG